MSYLDFANHDAVGGNSNMINNVILSSDIERLNSDEWDLLGGHIQSLNDVTDDHASLEETEHSHHDSHLKVDVTMIVFMSLIAG